MPFIVETPAAHPSIKLYVTRALPPSRSICLAGVRDEAIQFPTRGAADAARGRFSSLYGLIIVDVPG